MPQGKKLQVIIDHLDAFVDRLLSRIADDSIEGCSALISSIEAAKKNYKKPIESWLTGWFYQYSRVRSPQIDKAIKGMEAFPDSVTRLQEFKTLIGEGEWQKGSYNYYLFVELIKSVPDYLPLESELEHGVFLRIKELTLNKIDSYVAQYQATQKLIASREKERLAAEQNKQKSTYNAVLSNSLEGAQSAQKQHPEQISFGLILKNKLWSLSWIDSTGKSIALNAGKELISLLTDANTQDIEKINSTLEKKIKKECLKAWSEFLEKIQLLLNPKDSATQIVLNSDLLIAKGVRSTFILWGKAKEYSLSWINSLGKEQVLSLDKYPQLQKWLDTQKSLEGEKLLELKALLMQVNTSKSLHGMEGFKKELQACLSHTSKNKSTKAKLESKPLDLSLFTELEKCLGKRDLKVEEKEKDSKSNEELLIDELSSSPQITKKNQTGRLNLDKFSNVSMLFRQNSQEKSQACAEPKSVNSL